MDAWDQFTQHHLAEAHKFLEVVGPDHVMTNKELNAMLHHIKVWGWTAQDCIQSYNQLAYLKRLQKSKDKHYYWVWLDHGTRRKCVYMSKEEVSNKYSKYELIG